MFDPETLLGSETQGAMSTEYTPIPIGEYVGIIKDLNVKQVVSQKNGETYNFFEIKYAIDDQEVAEITGMTEPVARQSMILDITPGGTLDLGKGKNVQLGRLRAACKQNDPSKPWSFEMLRGQTVKVSIKHRTADDGQIYAEVKNVAPL